MAPFRSFDGFSKPIEGTIDRTASGGFITLVASTAAALLFLSQLVVYVRVQTRHSMFLAESIPSTLFDNMGAGYNHRMPGNSMIPLRLHVTFPHVPCSHLDYSHDGNSKSGDKWDHYHVRPWTFTLRIPTSQETKLAVYGDDDVTTFQRPNPKSGCTVQGTIRIPRVGGSLSVTVSPDAWREAATRQSFAPGPQEGLQMPGGGSPPGVGRLPNVTHYVHDVQFGAPFPPGTNPLRGAHHKIDNGSGVALASVAVKLVPTTYSLPFRADRDTYQASVSSHMVQPETLAAQHSNLLPGLQISYDFTPIAVRHAEEREGWLIFISSLASIVGGVFVTVGLVTGCLVNSAAAVAKKMD